MLDQYTPSNVMITPEIGELLRQFRLSRNVSSKAIADDLRKTPSYVTKMERGLLKKIDTTSFLSICNLISDSAEGVSAFLNKVKDIMHSMKKAEAFSSETRVSLMNIHDCIVPFLVPSAVRDYVNRFIEDHNISIEALADTINRNEDICNEPGYRMFPINQWALISTYMNNDAHDTFEMMIFKANYAPAYIGGILDGSIHTTHRATLSVLLRAVISILAAEHANTDLEENPSHYSVETMLDAYGIPAFNFVYGDTINIDSLSDVDEFDSDTKPLIQDIISSMKIIYTKNPDRGIPGLTRLSENLRNDLGFVYAYLNTDLTPLKDKTREQKQQFLNEVRDLVKKYSEQDPDVELFY